MGSRRATVSFALLQVTLGLVLLAGLWFAWPGWRLGMISDQVHRRYPGVPTFSTADLNVWLADPAKSKPYLIDVRSAEEFAVSHLVSAVRVDPTADLATAALPEDHSRVVITYCATSEVAAPFAVRLQEAGYTRVFTLEGGIIRWANEGRAMTDGKLLVTRVLATNDRTRTLLSRLHRLPSKPAP